MGITQRWVVVLYRRFGSNYRSHLKESKSPKRKLSSWTSRPLKMGPIGYPETSVQSYHSTLRNIPDERRCRLHRGGSLKSRIARNCQLTATVSYPVPYSGNALRNRLCFLAVFKFSTKIANNPQLLLLLCTCHCC
jgi:hypothetical protein